MSEKPTLLRNVRIVLWAMVLLAGIGASWLFLWGPRAPGAVAETRSSNPVTDTIGQGDYKLVTGKGDSFTEASLKGQPSLVFFGFTHCPDVCPTTLGDIMGWQEALGPLAKDLKVWFVTVDGERDTPEVIDSYVSWLPGAQGVTGSSEEIAKALKAFKIYARKVPMEGGDYSMDHSAYVMLFDAEGRYNQIFSYQEPEGQVVGKLKRFMEEQS